MCSCLRANRLLYMFIGKKDSMHQKPTRNNFALYNVIRIMNMKIAYIASEYGIRLNQFTSQVYYIEVLLKLKVPHVYSRIPRAQ